VRSGVGYEEFEGKRFARSPHVTASGGIDWQATRRLRLSAQARARSGYSDDLEGADAKVGAMALFDARAEYAIGRATLFVYARNLFDRFALIDRFADISASAEDPRMIGVGLETGF